MSAASNTRKRTFGATFRTLNDITNGSNVGANDAAGTENSNITVQHVPSLPDASEAARILRRIHSEFRVIIERRGWNVSSVTEMCCCGDGIDCLKKRKTKSMPNNVLGYNLITSSRRGKAHEIHLRLRHPHTHVLFDYESIAGTMCHELAHCVRGPHDAKFYNALEEIEEQYAVYLAKGVVLDKDGFPIGGESHVLGKSGRGAMNGSKKRAAADREKSWRAAESRRKKGGLTQGNVLGGRSSLSWRPKNPRDAARMAAERRLLDDQYCIPCDKVIEILNDSADEKSDDEVIEIVGNDSIETDAKKKVKSDRERDVKKGSTTSDGVIDLTTLDDSFTASPVTFNFASELKCNNDQKEGSKWSCPRCTLSNPEDILACGACHLERPCNKTVLEQAQEFKAENAIAFIKEREAQQSKDAFGGFNIYGEKKNSSSTMKHLT